MSQTSPQYPAGVVIKLSLWGVLTGVKCCGIVFGHKCSLWLKKVSEERRHLVNTDVAVSIEAEIS